MKRKVGIGLWAALLLLLLGASCTSKKKLVSPAPHADYQWMTAKINGEVSIPSDFSTFTFTGTLKMRRDSIVWVSASVIMGMESVRALVNQDSVFVINRMNQTYVAEPVPITLQEIQSLLFGDGTADHVEIQYGPYTAKIRYSDIHWNEPTTFPLKINKKYERMKL